MFRMSEHFEKEKEKLQRVNQDDPFHETNKIDTLTGR
jgi:hypothetical protein